MDSEKIEINITEGEELPTNVKRILKTLQIPSLTKEDRQSIRDLVEKTDELLYSFEKEKITQPLSDRLDRLIEVLEKSWNKINDFSGKFDRLVTLIDRDKERMQTLNDKLDKLEDSVLKDESARIIAEVSNHLNALLLSVQSNEDKINKILSSADKDSEQFQITNERLDKLTEIYLNDMSIPILKEVRDSLNSVLSYVQSNEERIVSLFSRALDNIEGINSTLSDIKGLVVESSEKIASDIERKTSALSENINERLDTYVSGANARLDNMSLQTIEPLNDISMRIEGLKNALTEDKIKSIVDGSVRKMNADVRRINSSINLLRSQATLTSLSEIAAIVRGFRVSRMMQPEKKRILAVLRGLEDDIIDILILKTVKKNMSTAQINSVLNMRDKLLKARLNRLVRLKKLSKKKKGRYFVFYVK